ncbi:MAG: SAM-dependent chlorinase/fluorinase [bacterium]|nr:MAG: SAM-dependent chlorinase/fluorinase [bacterium]
MSNTQSKKSPLYVTLLSDFGTEDGYVGAMKGVLLKGLPDLQVLDVSHSIKAFGIKQAAFSLMNYAFYFPPGTVHMVVVDPGVGTRREGLVVQSSEYFFIGPNNGVFSYIYQSTKYQAYRIREKQFGKKVSPTFHGRDIFAPAAVRLLKGDVVSDFCDPFQKLVSFYESYEDLGDDEYRLKVIHVDHFGNLILNFTMKDWESLGSPQDVRIQINHSFLVGIMKTFGDVPVDQLLMTWDSRGFLQIAQNCGNAAQSLSKKEGDHIQLKIFHLSHPKRTDI